MIMNTDQYNTQYNVGSHDETLMSSAIAGVEYKWTDRIVPYKFSEKYQLNDRQTQIVKSAVDHMNQQLQGCVTIRPAHSTDTNVVVVNGPRNGGKCNSFVGRQNLDNRTEVINGQRLQEINFGRDDGPGRTCYTQRTVIHEFLHTLGFYHEQSRPDRDDYVEIRHQNIRPNSAHNFIKRHDSLTFNVPYDGRSIMHYRHNAFAKRGAVTIHSKTDVWIDEELGKSEELTTWDIMKVQEMYDCDKTISHLKLMQNGVGIVTRVLVKIVGEKFKEVKNLIKDMDETISGILSKLVKIERIDIEMRDTYRADYWKMKSELESSRDTLKELAFSTITSVRDIKFLMEHWSDHDPELAAYTLKKGIYMLTKLLDVSEQYLDEAQQKYRNAIIFMESESSLPFQIDDAEKQLAELRKETRENNILIPGKKTATTILTVGGAAVMASFIASVILDAVGCLGACTAIVGTTVGAAGAGTTLIVNGIEITEMKKNVEIVERKIRNIKRDLSGLKKNFEETKALLKVEKDAITRWKAATADMQDKVEIYPLEELTKWAPARRQFTLGLDDLSSAAEAFLDISGTDKAKLGNSQQASVAQGQVQSGAVTERLEDRATNRKPK